MLNHFVLKIQSVWSSIVTLIIKDDQTLKNRILKGAFGSFGLKIVASGLAFLISIIFARCLGTAGLGNYSYATTWVNLLSIPATLGIDQLLVKEMAVYRQLSQWGLMRGLLRWSNLVVLGSSLALTIVAIALVGVIKVDLDQAVLLALALALTSIPLASLRNLRNGAMGGLHRVVIGQIPDAIFAPGIIIVLTSLAFWLFPDRANVLWVLAIKIIAVALTLVLGSFWLWRSLPKEVRLVKPQFVPGEWLTGALPFMFMGTVELINSRLDIIMLGSLKGVKAVGIYTVIVGITQLTAMVHHSALNVLAPNIAALYSEGNFRQLEKLVQKSVLGVFLASLLISGAIVLLGKYLLLIFGADFLLGRSAMNILIAGQLFNALTGPVGLLLNMTGYQNYTAIASGVSALLNIMLNYLLIPQWGIIGAAIATSASLIIINIMKVIWLRQKLKISLYTFI